MEAATDQQTGHNDGSDGVELTHQQAMDVLNEARHHKENAVRILSDIESEQATMLGGPWTGESAGGYQTLAASQHDTATDIIRRLEGLIAQAEDSVAQLGSVDQDV